MKLMLALFAVANAASLAPALKLRGGSISIAGIEPEQIAMGLTVLQGLQGVMSTTNVDQVFEMYEIPKSGDTPTARFICEQSGAIMLGSAIAAYLVLGGGDAAEAVGYANIPGLLLNLKNLNDGVTDKLGWGDQAKYGPLVVSGVLTAALLGKVDALGPADALKYSAYWMLANAAGMYLAPDKAMEAWGASIKGDTETNMLKLFAQFAGTFGLFALKLSDGASALEAIGYAWALGTACIVDGVYVSKYSVGNPDKATPWIAMGAVGAYALLA